MLLFLAVFTVNAIIALFTKLKGELGETNHNVSGFSKKSQTRLVLVSVFKTLWFKR